MIESGLIPMRILIAPDKFKGSLSSREAAQAISRGFSRGWPEAEKAICPLADGGEGTMEVMVDATGGKTVECDVTGPLGKQRRASLGILGDGRTAVVEMAAASGLELIPPAERDPGATTTAGTGELILCALDMGIRRVVVGIGGSATNDGGTGMASALGVRFLDARGEELPRGGANLTSLVRLDMRGLDPRVKDSEIVVASDVTNPLLGDSGASMVYAPQKGASEEEVELLERGLARLAELASAFISPGLEEKPGAGAAGGLGFGLAAFLGASIRPGIEVVMEAVGFQAMLKGCGLVITGEGKLDSQTAYGKTVIGVAREAHGRGIPVLALGGEVARGAEELQSMGITSILGISLGPISLDESIRRGGELLERTSFGLANLLRACPW